MTNFELRSSDNQTFAIEEKFGRESKTTRQLINSGAGYTTITLSVRGEIVSRVIRYFHQRHAIDNDDESNPSAFEQALNTFDIQFVDGIESHVLLPLFVIARSLDMSRLMDALIQKMCDMVKDKSPDEIRREFGFYDISTSEEDVQIRQIIEKIK